MKNNNVGDERTSSQWFCVWQRSGIILESNIYKKWKFVNEILLLMSHNNSWLFLHGISDWRMMVCHQRPCLFIVQPLIRWLYIFSPHIAGKSWNQFVSDGLTLFVQKKGRTRTCSHNHSPPKTIKKKSRTYKNGGLFVINLTKFYVLFIIVCWRFLSWRWS